MKTCLLMLLLVTIPSCEAWGALWFSEGPKNITVNQGETAFFECAFTGYRPSTVCWLKAVDPAQSVAVLWSPRESFIELSSNKKFCEPCIHDKKFLLFKEVPKSELVKLNESRFTSKLGIESVEVVHSGMYACYVSSDSCNMADIEREHRWPRENFAYLEIIPEPGKIYQ